jgi:hypothetical protein
MPSKKFFARPKPLRKHIERFLRRFGVNFPRRSRGKHIVFGFDSAWANDPKSPGAITAVGFDSDGTAEAEENFYAQRDVLDMVA